METIERPIFSSLREALADQRVIVLTGMRRVGKTTTIRWLLEQNPHQNKIYIDLERQDQRAVFSEANYELVIHYLRNLGLDPTQPMTVALDEIQYVPNLPSVVKYLLDHYGIKFLLTGTSFFYLKNYFSESMAGRKIIYELYPLRFGEFLDFHGVPYRAKRSIEEMKFDNYEYQRLKGYYEEYLTFGGLPSVALEPKPHLKREILEDIYSSYINIDVRVIADFRKIHELQQLLKALAIRIGNKIDLSKLAQVVGISRPTLNDYLEFLERTYIIHQLPPFAGVDKTLTLGKKLYFRDNGITSILAHPGDGALFENSVFNQLWALGELAYLSRKNEYEVDFVLAPEEEPPVALEVKYHPVASDQNKLKRIATRNGFDRYWIIGKYATPVFDQFLWGGSIF